MVVDVKVGLAAAVAAAASLAICDVSPAAEEEEDAVDVLAVTMDRILNTIQHVKDIFPAVALSHRGAGFNFG